MKILVIGGGGREHALAWKLSKDGVKPSLFCAPGNGGTAEIATNLPIEAENVSALLDWAKKNQPDLTVVGPEAPLCAGICDLFSAEGLKVFGPSKAAAMLEGSKVFSKEVLVAGNVPTAKAKSFTVAAEALAYLDTVGAPVVVKAEGLAAGKGVYVCKTVAEAKAAVSEVMVKKAFGDAGNRLIVEEFLEGEEASIMALVDGKTVVMLASSQDHKRVFNNDEGPNTGGMGAYSPAPVVTDELWPVIREQVFERTLAELRKRGITYKGVLYAGVMVTATGPKVLEFNCRFGDPETEAVLPRMASDLTPALMACVDGTLKEEMVKWRPDPCVCVVMVSGGYPGHYVKGKVIEGLKEAGAIKNVAVFHAGTKLDGGRAVTSGGRVLGVTATAQDLQHAVKLAYVAITKLKFDQAQYRTDIAARALKRK
jgi:phosphoribosylamine--glycine ligase